jgi:hypothetical protein
LVPIRVAAAVGLLSLATRVRTTLTSSTGTGPEGCAGGAAGEGLAGAGAGGIAAPPAGDVGSGGAGAVVVGAAVVDGAAGLVTSLWPIDSAVVAVGATVEDAVGLDDVEEEVTVATSVGS